MEPVKILVVEDEMLVANGLERMLNKLGYIVPALVSDGKSAVELACQHAVNLVLMDIKLRGEMDGVDAAIQIRSRSDIPIIFLTAHSDELTLERAKAATPSGYLLKPVDQYQLRITLEMALHFYDVEKKARINEKRYQTILASALDGFVSMDLEGQILDANPAYCKLVGYSRNELLSLKWSALETNSYWQRVDHLDFVPARYESAHRAKSGENVNVEVSINSLAEQGVVFALLRSIDERKRAEAQILKLNIDLERQSIKNRRLYQQEREQRELTQSLVEASQVLTSSLDIEVVLDRILQQVGHIVKNDVSNIILLEGDEVRVVRTHGYEQFDVGSFIETFVFPLEGLSIRRHIVQTSKPVVVPDVRVDHRWRLAEEKVWLRSYVAAPIRVMDKVIGILNVGISQPGFYNESHGFWLSAFANHAAIAFQNARLFENVELAAEKQAFLSHRLLAIQESERRYLARELHDEVGQTLTAARLSMRALMRLPERAKREAKMKESLDILELALNQVRNMSLDLRPSMLDDLGLLPALRWYVERESEWGNFSGQVSAADGFPRMASDLELVCFRIAQESLTNVMRHAKATRVDVRLNICDGQCILEIQDNGTGFDVSAALVKAGRGQSLGLLGMQERASLMNGRLEIESHIEKGTIIRAILPIREESTPEERTI